MFVDLSISAVRIRNFLLATAFTLTLPSAGLANSDLHDCENAVQLNLQETTRSFAYPDSEWLRLDVSGAGWVRLEVSSLLGAGSLPALSFWGAECSVPGQDRLRILERTPSAVIAWAPSAGPLLFRVVAGDPLAALGAIASRGAFLAYKQRLDDGIRKEGEDEDEIEIDAGSGAPEPLPCDDPLAGCSVVPGKEGEDEDEIEIDAGSGMPETLPCAIRPEGCRVIASREGEDEDEIEIDAGSGAPIVVPPGFGREAILCRAESAAQEGDDHLDSLYCATPVQSREVTGVIDNDWGDDQDSFRIDLGSSRQLWQLVIEGSGDLDTVVTLFDERGQELARLVADPADGTWRLSRALLGGVYTLRVEGLEGTEGVYRLAFSTAAL